MAKAKKAVPKKVTRRGPAKKKAAVAAGGSIRAAVFAALTGRARKVTDLAAELGVAERQVRGAIDGLRATGIAIRSLGDGKFSTR